MPGLADQRNALGLGLGRFKRKFFMFTILSTYQVLTDLGISPVLAFVATMFVSAFLYKRFKR